VRLVLLGAPGSGKGTQADFLKERYGCAHISTGDILRQNLSDGTELGQKAKVFMDRGELVPDALVVEMVKARLRERDTEKSFLMDGFPRTIPQAEALAKTLAELDRHLDGVVLLNIDEELLVQRLVNRRTCRSCGKIWNLLNMGAAENCPDCGGELFQRDDDAEPVIRNRLKVYHEQTSPLVSWYKEKWLLRAVDAAGSPEEIFKKIQAALNK